MIYILTKSDEATRILEEAGRITASHCWAPRGPHLADACYRLQSLAWEWLGQGSAGRGGLEVCGRGNSAACHSGEHLELPEAEPGAS